jgi:hypothetical protein
MGQWAHSRPGKICWCSVMVFKFKIVWMCTLQVNYDAWLNVCRVCHGYGNTRGDRVTGTTGTGTVLVFGTPRHTVPVPRYHGYFTGILRQGDHNFYCFETHFFSYLIFFFPSCHGVTQPNMALPATCTCLPLTIKLSNSPLTPTPISLQKTM